MTTSENILEQILHLSSRMAETRLLPPLLVYAVDVALELFNAEQGFLILQNHRGMLDFPVSRARHHTDIHDPVSQISHSIVQQALNERKSIVAANALDDPAFDSAPSVKALRLRSVMCVPLIANNDVLGALYLDNRLEHNVFTQTDLKFLQIFANQAAVSIANAMLNDALESRIQDRTSELQRTNQRLQEEIVERQKAQQRLLEMMLEKERMRVLTNFIQDASHQFYTPLSVINTSVYLLKRKSDSADQHYSQIETQVQVISELVHTLVLMVQLESDPPSEHGVVDIRQIANNLHIKFAAAANQRGIHLKTYCASNLTPVWGRAEHLERALYELVRNAIQHTPAGGEVNVNVYMRDREMIAEVEDSGVGIEQEEIPLIFNRFYRNDKIGTTRGLGLGLSIAQKVAENHKGHISVTSTPGQGSLFQFILPVHEAAL